MARQVVIRNEEKASNMTGQYGERGKSTRHVQMNGRALGQVTFCAAWYHASLIYIRGSNQY